MVHPAGDRVEAGAADVEVRGINDDSYCYVAIIRCNIL